MTLLRPATYLTLLIGSVLLFLIQPWIYSWLMPRFGGGAHLWAAVLVFFQWGVALAYGIAAWSFSRCSPRQLLSFFGALALLAFYQLSYLFSEEDSFHSEPPDFFLILSWLTARVGALTLLLAASPLVLQALWAKAGESTPTRLYGWSNLASIGSLTLYPIIVEPSLELSEIGRGIALGLGLWCAGLVVIVSEVAKRTYSALPSFPAPAALRLGEWFTVGLLGVALMTAAARDVAVDSAGVPFVGLLPLIAFLLATALAFADLVALSRWVGGAFATIALVWMMEVLKLGGDNGLLAELSAYSIVVFVLTYLLTAELRPARIRSDVLLWHYFAMSAGGGLGGLLVSLVSPELWTTVLEFHLATLLSVVWLGMRSQAKRSRDSEDLRGRLRVGAVWLGACLFWGSGTYQLVQVQGELSGWSVRSFLGRLSMETLKVKADGSERELRVLVNGRTFHGGVLTEVPSDRAIPVTYYSPSSGYGRALTTLQEHRQEAGLVLGGIGLGLGGGTENLRAGDHFIFWELDPLVIDAAESERFGQLKRVRDRGVNVETQVIDGRMGVRSLVERGEGKLDGLVLDAFSSDSIPSHLLTVEAFETYWQSLQGDGLILVHISNRHLDLLPVMVGAATHHQARLAYHYLEGNREQGTFDASWVVMWRDASLDRSLAMSGLEALDMRELHSLTWHDQKKDVWSIVKWQR